MIIVVVSDPIRYYYFCRWPHVNPLCVHGCRNPYVYVSDPICRSCCEWLHIIITVSNSIWFLLLWVTWYVRCCYCEWLYMIIVIESHPIWSSLLFWGTPYDHCCCQGPYTVLSFCGWPHVILFVWVRMCICVRVCLCKPICYCEWCPIWSLLLWVTRYHRCCCEWPNIWSLWVVPYDRCYCEWSYLAIIVIIVTPYDHYHSESPHMIIIIVFDPIWSGSLSEGVWSFWITVCHLMPRQMT